METKEAEWERLISTRSPESPVGAPPALDDTAVAPYSHNRETETLIAKSADSSFSGNIAAYFNSAASHSTSSTPQSTDHKSSNINTNPKINLSYPSTDFTTDTPSSAENNSPRSDSKVVVSEINQENENSERSFLSSSSCSDNHKESPTNSFHKPDTKTDDDARSVSKLSASPDFWRRVSPQLIYIDSASYGGCSDSVHSSGSVITTRGRSSDRTYEVERAAKYRRGRSVDSSRELDDNTDRFSRDIEGSVPRLNSDRSVSWNLADDAQDEEEWEAEKRDCSKESKQPHWKLVKHEIEHERNLLCNVSKETGENLNNEDEIKVVLEALNNNDEYSEGVIAKLLRKLNNVTNNSSIRYDKNTPMKISAIRNSKDSSVKKKCTVSEDRETKHPEQIFQADKKLKLKSSSSVEAITSSTYTSKGSSAGTLRKLKEKEANEVYNVNIEYNNAPKASEEKGLDLISTELTVIPETKSRGKFRRYFSLDSSPVAKSKERPQVHQHQDPKQFRRRPIRRPQLQHGQRLRPPHLGAHVPELPPNSRGGPYNQHQLYYMEKDLRYFFQHPWLRLIIAYLVIFCNFLLFAEDPLSHSHTESNINVVGNVFSFVANKYPTEWYWKTIKVATWVVAALCGMLVGKVLIHGLVCKRIFRLKMFRDEQGSWMCMFLTVIVAMYMFSYVYNLLLLIAHPHHLRWQITSAMGVTNESMMKAAATCTWLGDLVTALMVTDMMLQDRLYPYWGTRFRKLYKISNIPRIMIFWVGSIAVSAVVIFLIVSDYISWNKLNKGFVETTELSRAFLASFILVMDLIIVMQDWDFPHFTSTVDVNLPGFSTHTLHWKWAKLSFTGKWFNYGIIFMVMILDLNMWKNQLFYQPEDYGQYIDPSSNMVWIVEDPTVLSSGNKTHWTWQYRSQVNIDSGEMLRADDSFMYSRWMGYTTGVKCTAFIPNVLGMIMFFTLVTLYGRFPPNQDGTYGGRLKKRQRSSWRHERRSICEQNQYCSEFSSEYGNSLYPTPQCRGDPCYNDCPCVGCNRYMARCSSSQPDFKNPHYSDPAIVRTNNSKASSPDFTEEGNDEPSDEDYSITQHSDPGLIESRQPKVQYKPSEYRDIRVFDDATTLSGEAASSEQELQQQFTKILAENDRKFTERGSSWSQPRVDNPDSDLTADHENYFTNRLTKMWRENYANKFKFTFMRKSIDIPNVNEDEELNCSPEREVAEVITLRLEEENVDVDDVSFCENYSELVDTGGDTDIKIHAKRKKCPVTDSQDQSSSNKALHKRMSSNSSTEVKLIEPAKIRIDGIRFFRRRKQNIVPEINVGGSFQVEESETDLPESRCSDKPQVDSLIKSSNSGEEFSERQVEEGVQILTRIRSSDREFGVRTDQEESPVQVHNSDLIHSINFGSNASVNL